MKNNETQANCFMSVNLNRLISVTCDHNLNSCFFYLQGLRVAAICGVLGTCIGAWIKVFSVQPDLFWLAFVGQSIVAASQCFILSLPAKLAAVWFGPDQVSSACSIGVFGNQVKMHLICSIQNIYIIFCSNKLLTVLFTMKNCCRLITVSLL